jgi:SAM-dependent methyltransferase
VRVNPDTFEATYREARDGDPWDFAGSAYEQRRYDLTVGCLDRPRYRRAFEPGCATGELTARLVARCDEVVALDPSPSALARARDRVGDRPGVRIDLGAVPEDWPAGCFDLIVLSEIGYYFDQADLAALIQRCVDSQAPDAQLLAVHWRGHSDDHVQHGDDVHRQLVDTLGRQPDVELRDPGFLLARWDRR